MIKKERKVMKLIKEDLIKIFKDNKLNNNNKVMKMKCIKI